MEGGEYADYLIKRLRRMISRFTISIKLISEFNSYLKQIHVLNNKPRKPDK